MRGKKTPRDVKAKFRAAFLQTGNACEAARQCKLPIRTGQLLKRQLEDDPAFAKACADLYTRRYAEVEELIVDAAHTAHELVTSSGTFYTPEKIASIAKKSGLKSLSFNDPRPAFMRGLAEVGKVIQNARKVATDAEAPTGPALIVNLTVAKDDKSGAA